MLYGYTPNEIGEMTFYQINTLLAGEEHLGAGTFTVDAGEANSICNSLQTNRQLRGL